LVDVNYYFESGVDMEFIDTFT